MRLIITLTALALAVFYLATGAAPDEAARFLRSLL
jgi:hypothetical protein